MTTWHNPAESGQGWDYNQEGVTYNGATDTVTNNIVYYNSEGTPSTWTFETRN
jgi:hypothetical protein